MAIDPKWLILLHQIPATPGYLRAKIARKLAQIGAVAIKNSAYLLPSTDETLEDFQWLRREIEHGGGAAWIFQCEPAAGLSDDALREEFRKARAPEFAELANALRAALSDYRAADEPFFSEAETTFRKLEERCQEICRIDFFQAPGRREVDALMNDIKHFREEKRQGAASVRATGELTECTWVTRRGVKVDRIACSWLIQRFIDPAARFVFVDPQSYRRADSDLRFDMFEGEFGHQGDLCSFEVLLRDFVLRDSALIEIAEVVHEIDLKDEKYRRAETPGIRVLIDGLVRTHDDDLARVRAGAALFDALYAQFKAAQVT